MQKEIKTDAKLSESAIQQSCVIWYKNAFCLKHHSPRCMIFSIPNEGRGAASMQLMATGLYPGAADFQVIHRRGERAVSFNGIVYHNYMLFVEVKAPENTSGPRKNGQSQKQIDFEDHCKAMGLGYHIVRSLYEFKQVIENL